MPATRTFRLYQQEARWWSFADYGTLLDIVVRLRPRTVLEFGPGSSTLAIVEGGAERVDSFEDDPKWISAHAPRFAGLPVVLRRYTHADPLVISDIGERTFDFGFVDGPRETDTRGVEIAYALARCSAIACHDALSAPVIAALDVARASGRQVEIVRYDRNPGEPHAIGVVLPR
jgi:predicted O-methyltransferase YrrM